MAGDIVINVRAGTYRPAQPLSLTAADSGSNGHRVIYQAYGYGTQNQESVEISGGRQVTGWSLDGAGANIWKADVGSLETCQLYVNGQRAPRASIQNTLPMTETPTGYIDQSLSSSNWSNPGDIEAVWHRTAANWSEPRCGIASITAGTLIMDQPCFSRYLETNIAGTFPGRAPSSFENSKSFLTQPGTFVLDTSQPGHHMLFYIPRSGENLGQANVVAPTLESLVNAKGSAATPVHDITFQGFDFTDATWLQPNTTAGFPHYLASLVENGDGTIYGATASNQLRTVPANLEFLYSDRITFEGNRFHRLGATGLEISGSDNIIRGNVFTDVSAAGIVAGAAQAATSGAAGNDNLIADNWIHDVGVEYQGAGTGITALSTTGTTISHNQINSLPDRGIFVAELCHNTSSTTTDPITSQFPALPVCRQGGPSLAAGNQGTKILNNLIFDVMKTMGDGGGIYTVGAQGSSYDTGAVIRGNVVHDTDSLKQVVAGPLGTPVNIGIYNDFGTQWASVESNVVYNVEHSAGGASAPVVAQDQYLMYLRNFWVDELYWPWTPALDVTEQGNTILPRESFTAACNASVDCATILQGAGLESTYQHLLNS